MTVAQKVPLRTGRAGRFGQRLHRSRRKPPPRWPKRSRPSPASTWIRLLLFGGWESASRGAGATMQIVGEMLGITDQFQGVDAVDRPGRRHACESWSGSKAAGTRSPSAPAPPALLGWATGNLPEPSNNPQVGMANMRAIMPALQRAKPAKVGADGVAFAKVALPRQQRETKVVKDLTPDDIAREIVAWIRA